MYVYVHVDLTYYKNYYFKKNLNYRHTFRYALTPGEIRKIKFQRIKLYYGTGIILGLVVMLTLRMLKL